jgi:hypothetical protein
VSDYQIADHRASSAFAEFLQKEGQFLLPIVGLIETAQVAIGEVIDVTGRATIEAVLRLSAEQIAGQKHPGKAQRGNSMANVSTRNYRHARSGGRQLRIQR